MSTATTLAVIWSAVSLVLAWRFGSWLQSIDDAASSSKEGER